MDSEFKKEWIERAEKENYKIISLIYDIEDKSYFPVFFLSESEEDKFKKYIISESKLKFIKSYYL